MKKQIEESTASIVVLALGIAFGMLACDCGPKPCPKPPSTLDGGGIPGSPEAACANLSAFSCPEGSEHDGTTCVQRMTKYQANPYLGVDLKCIANAGSKDELAACKVRCQ